MTTLVTRRMTMCDWNDNLFAEMSVDAGRFRFNYVHLQDESCMGLEVFEITGTEEALSNFADFYDLEWDDEQA